MKTHNSVKFEMYQKLGELFYAIAAADKVIRKAEVDTLRNLIKKYWKDVDELEDEFHTDAAYQIEIVFDWLDTKQLDAQECFNTFKDFKKEHPSLFSETIKRLTWKTADAIAASFAGKNKSELIMLTKLKIELQN